MCRAILAKLGYAILMPEEFELLQPDGASPDLRIVDERNLAEVPDEEEPSVPIILLTGRHGATGVDSRIAGAIRRPAGLHELFSLAQQILEEKPRAAPRVPTHLAARCSSKGHEWKGSVLSLSESGCLLRTPESLTLGSTLELCFELPRTGPLTVEAECAYQLVPDVGLVFHALSSAQREAVSGYIGEALNEA